MMIEGLMCHFPWVTYLNFKRTLCHIPLPRNFKGWDFLPLKMHKIHGVLHVKLALILFSWPVP